MNFIQLFPIYLPAFQVAATLLTCDSYVRNHCNTYETSLVRISNRVNFFNTDPGMLFEN